MNDFEVRDETMKIQDFQAESKINYLHESTKCATNPIFSCFFKSVLLLRALSPWKDFYYHLSSSDSTVPSFAT